MRGGPPPVKSIFAPRPVPKAGEAIGDCARPQNLVVQPLLFFSFFFFFCSRLYKMRLNRKKGSIYRRSKLKQCLRVIIISLLLIIVYFKLPEKTERMDDVLESDYLAALKGLVDGVKSFSHCNGFSSIITKIVDYGSFTEVVSGFHHDQQAFLSTTIGNSLYNFSTPRGILAYFFEKELPKYNFEAELQLQSNLIHHEPLFSPEFNDPTHVSRRGYGLGGSIFVGLLPSFTNDCSTTVESIFNNAYYPASIFIGVVESDSDEKENCLPKKFGFITKQEKLGFTYSDNLRFKRFHAPIANEVQENGKSSELSPEDPLRFAVLQLYRGESYILILRPRVVLSPGWDWTVRLLYLHESQGGKKVVLTSASSNLENELESTIQQLLFPPNFSFRSTSTEEVFTPSIWEESSFLKLLENCPLCLRLLILPSKCLTARIKETVISELPYVPSIFKTIIYELLDEKDRKNTTDFLSIKMDSMPMSEIFDYIYSSFTTSDKSSNKIDFVSTAFLSFASMQCDLFSGEKSTSVNKRNVELCWVRYFKSDLFSYINSMLGKSPTVVVPNFSNSSDFIIKEERQRTSNALDELRYIEDDPKNTHFQRSLDHMLVSLDFVFSQAEAFTEIPDELQLDVPHAKCENSSHSSSVMFDPYLVALRSVEADLIASAKFWTNGWDIKTLTEPLAFSFHNLVNKSELPGSSSKDGSKITKARKETVKRIRAIFFSLLPEESAVVVGNRFKLGVKRKIMEYFKFAGIIEFNATLVQWEKL